MYLESKPSDSSREISKSPYCECRVRGSFCERSEEYDVYYVVLDGSRSLIFSMTCYKVCLLSSLL